MQKIKKMNEAIYDLQQKMKQMMKSRKSTQSSALLLFSRPILTERLLGLDDRGRGNCVPGGGTVGCGARGDAGEREIEPNLGRTLGLT